MSVTVDALALDLTDLRNRSGLSRRQLGDLMDVSTVAVHQWESGTTMPAPHRLPYLATVLDVSVDELQAALNQAYRERKET